MWSLIRTSLVVGALVSVSSCALPYYWQAAAGQIDLVRRRVPIETVLADPSEPQAVKDTLRLVIDMRRFAVEVLDLPDNDSYRSYADLGRPYVVWNVVAAGEFEVDPLQWCFALLGCVSYRGYFSQDAAEKYAAMLDSEGFDTFVAGASAYSTLGYFSDPVLSTMLVGGESYIAGILFHELAHQKFYVKGDSDLNEAFASAVQQYGTSAWLAQRGSAQDLDAYHRRLRRQSDFSSLVSLQRDRLMKIYASEMTQADMRAAKAAAFAQMREDYARYKRSWGGASDYDAWFDRPLNNAQIASVATYRRWLPGLLWYLDHNGLAAMYDQMTVLENLTQAQRSDRLQAWVDAANGDAIAGVVGN